MIDRPRSIFLQLADETRAEYKTDVMPSIDSSKGITATVRTIRGLQADREALTLLVREMRQDGPIDDEGYELLDAFQLELKQKFEQFGEEARMPVVISQLFEERREYLNEVIARTNNLRSQALIASGTASLDHIVLSRRPLIPFTHKLMKFREPKSPNKAHNDLDENPIYRAPNTFHPISRLVQQISTQDKEQPFTPVQARTAVAIAHLMPNVVFDQGTRAMPSQLSNKAEVARGVISATKQFYDFEHGRLRYPNGEEVGAKGDKQDEYIYEFLVAGTAEVIGAELMAPSFTEDSVRELYQQYGQQIIELAAWIGQDGTDRLGGLFENMPPVLGTIATSRMSDILYAHCGFPYASTASELRLSRALRNVIFDPRKDRTNTLLDKIGERLNSDDLDPRVIAAHIGSLDYIEYLVEQLIEKADPSHTETIEALFEHDPELAKVVKTPTRRTMGRGYSERPLASEEAETDLKTILMDISTRELPTTYVSHPRNSD